MKTVESDYYAVLELKPASSIEEVKSQYRRLAKRYHPDLNNNDAQCQEKLLRVNAAYAFLSDAARKAAYDARPKPAAAPPSASAPKPTPAIRPKPSVTATGYHAPAARQPLAAMADLRMTRSGWLGATAAVVLVLLGIGLSMNSGDQTHIGRVETVPSISSADTPSMDAPNVATTDDAALDSGQPEAAPPPVPVPTAPPLTFPAAPGSIPTLPPRLSARTRPFRAESAPLPKGNGLISHKDSVYSFRQDTVPARPRMTDAERRVLLTRLAAELQDLKATRRRIKPAIAQFARQHTTEAQARDTGPLLTDMQTLKQQRQSVRNNIQAFSTTPTARPAPTVAASPTIHAAPSRSFIASVVTPVSVKPAGKPASKPKAPEPAAPSFITWSK